MKIIARLVFIIAALYISIACCAWELNNPKANRMTFWTHFGEAIRFKKNPRFQ